MIRKLLKAIWPGIRDNSIWALGGWLLGFISLSGLIATLWVFWSWTVSTARAIAAWNGTYIILGLIVAFAIGFALGDRRDRRIREAKIEADKKAEAASAAQAERDRRVKLKNAASKVYEAIRLLNYHIEENEAPTHETIGAVNVVLNRLEEIGIKLPDDSNLEQRQWMVMWSNFFRISLAHMFEGDVEQVRRYAEMSVEKARELRDANEAKAAKAKQASGSKV